MYRETVDLAELGARGSGGALQESAPGSPRGMARCGGTCHRAGRPASAAGGDGKSAGQCLGKFTSRTEHARIEFGKKTIGEQETVYFVRDNGAGCNPRFTPIKPIQAPFSVCTAPMSSRERASAWQRYSASSGGMAGAYGPRGPAQPGGGVLLHARRRRRMTLKTRINLPDCSHSPNGRGPGVRAQGDTSISDNVYSLSHGAIPGAFPASA